MHQLNNPVFQAQVGYDDGVGTGPLHHRNVDIGCRNDDVGTVGVQTQFIDPVFETVTRDEISHPFNFSQRRGVCYFGNEVEDFVDVTTRSDGHQLLGFPDVFFDPFLHLVPGTFRFFSLQKANRANFERFGVDFLPIQVEVQLGTSTTHIDVQKLPLVECLNHHIVDQFGFFLSVNDVNLNAGQFLDAGCYLMTIGRFAHGRRCAGHEIFHFVKLHQQFVNLHQFVGSNLALRRNFAKVEHIVSETQRKTDVFNLFKTSHVVDVQNRRNLKPGRVGANVDSSNFQCEVGKVGTETPKYTEFTAVDEMERLFSGVIFRLTGLLKSSGRWLPLRPVGPSPITCCMTILGISAYYHDSAAALLEDGRIVAAAQEERFSRKKHDAGFPVNAIRFCLDYGGVTLNELDAIVFYDKPLLKFERLLETYYAFAPRGLRSFLTAMPVWLKDKLFLKRLLRNELKKLGYDAEKPVRLLFPEHHLSHAASAFYPSPFEKAAILTIDGVGEWATASIGLGEKNRITVLKEQHFPHSLGLLYSAFTYFLGFRVNSGEYKVMGLAPYGDPQSPEVEQFVQLIKQKLVEIKDDGSIWLDQTYFDYATGLRMIREKKWEALFGLPRRKPDDELKAEHCNLALAIQRVTEEVVIKMAGEAKRLTNTDNLVLAGGVALNCVANGKLQKTGIFRNIFIQPAAGDAGGALGAALAAYYLYFDQNRVVDAQQDGLHGSYLGPEFSDQDVERMAKKYKAVFRRYDNFADLCDETARLLASENVVGWVQGRMEFGPRALGNRSILGDPRSADMQKKLNLKIKYRESFRPFAPSVLADDCADYFEYDGVSPYMLLVHPVRENRRKPLPAEYARFSLRDKLYVQRSDWPAITHVDFSARIQTVHRETNPRYWQLIDAFKQRTGCGMLVNTSFNVRGEPIVNTPEEAYRCFMRTAMDYLVIGNYRFDKNRQPVWPEKGEWKEEFTLD